MSVCANCGQDNPRGFRFCGACGMPLATAGRRLDEERKVVTVMFCDLVGFTARSDRADPEDVGAMLRPFHAKVRTEIERLGGTVDKLIGDAVMGVFGAPVAHEDDPERAVRCALRVLDAIGELNAATPSLSLTVRIGIATGEALIALAAGHQTETVVGDVVNTAARLQGVAPVNAAVVGEPTWRATRALFDFEGLEPVKVKGKAEPLASWRVVAAGGRVGAGARPGSAAPFIGRDDELTLLDRHVAWILAEGSPRFVTVLGTAGIGKSSLVQELFARVDARPEPVAWRQGRCLPYGDGISFWAFGEIVKAHAGVLGSDDAEQVAAKLDAAVAALVAAVPEREWMRARIAPLVGLATEAAKADRIESFTAWRRFIEAAAAARPLVLVVEDLHWADPVMLEFLDHLTERAADVPLLVVATARPELLERRPDWDRAGPRSVSVTLAPLTDGQTAALVTALLGRSLLPADVQALLLDRAGGNPLYAGEFVRLLTDRGLLVPGDRTVRLAAGAEIPFPDTVQALVAARLDTLPAEAKALVQDAAVLGRVFWSGGLAALSRLDERAVGNELGQLERRQLVRAAPSSAISGQTEYAFSHAVVRDVAYAQIPRAARARRHRAAAEWLAGLPDERAAGLAELIAHHFTSALALAVATRAPAAEIAELQEPARRALIMAGDRAINLDAVRASGYYRQALELSSPDDAEQARVLVKSAQAAYQATGRLAEAIPAYEHAIAALAAQGDRVGQAGAMERLAVLRWSQGDTRQSRAVLTKAAELLEHQPPSPELASVYAQMAASRTMAGQAQEALVLADEAVALADRFGLAQARLRALDARGVARCESGDLGGLDDLRAALDVGLAAGAGYETAVVYNLLVEPLWLTDGPQTALDTVEAALEFIERRGLAMEVWFKSSLLTLLFDLGRWDEVVETAAWIVAWEREHGGHYITVSAESYSAQVLCWRGRVTAARDLVDRLLPVAREIDDLQALVPALVTAAVVGHADGDLAVARAAVDELDRVVRGRSDGQWYRAQHMADLARVGVAVGRTALVRDLADQVWPDMARRRHGALAARAVLAEAEGRLDAAASLYDQAAEQWTTYGHLPERGHALLAAGRCLPEVGRPGAHERLADARAVFADLGAPPLLALADGRLAEIERSG
jgi:class 3 adenylate cyclase/tetratricopeptide (TPR) repeat protein